MIPKLCINATMYRHIVKFDYAKIINRWNGQLIGTDDMLSHRITNIYWYASSNKQNPLTTCYQILSF